MRIIGKKAVQYAKNMFVYRTGGEYANDKTPETLRMRAESKQDNRVREQNQRKEAHAYLDKIMNLMEENYESEYNKDPLRITFIFER